MAPPLQKNLQISFALDSGYGVIDLLTLPIKPEELSRAEPSRMAAVNSLDGAWIDAFGRGLAQLTISGHTGWGQGGRPDGVSQFLRLRDDFVHRWHTLRRDRISNGDDPNDVRLIFIDPLDGDYVAEVVPSNFALKRSKSQPLLLMYSLTMTVVNDRAQNPAPSLLQPIAQAQPAGAAGAATDPKAASTSVSQSVKALSGLQGRLASATASIGTFGRELRQLTTEKLLPIVSLADEVTKTAAMARGVMDASAQVAVNLASDLSFAASKVWGAAASVASLPEYAKADLLRVKREFSNLHCVLTHGFGGAMSSALSYSDLYGASNCSSTAGGLPASAFTVNGQNPFADLWRPSSLVFASPQAVQAVQEIKSTDMVEQAINQPRLTVLASQIRKGVALA